MSADLLRRAAVKLREHAERAPERPWVSLDNGDRLLAIRDDEAPGYRYLVDEPVDGPTADYFALMHPPVALALADALADRAEECNGPIGCVCWDADSTGASLLRVAREVLRRQP